MFPLPPLVGWADKGCVVSVGDVVVLTLCGCVELRVYVAMARVTCAELSRAAPILQRCEARAFSLFPAAERWPWVQLVSRPRGKGEGETGANGLTDRYLVCGSSDVITC